MIRTLTTLSVLAAAAAMAAPASAEDMHLSLTGKSPAAAYREIERAARTVCSPERGFDIYSLYLQSDCIATTVEATLAKVSDPALQQYSQARKEFLKVASR